MKHSILSLLFVASCSTTAATPAAAPLTLAPASVASTPPPVRADTVIELAARRARVLEGLRAYRLAGTYPTDGSGMPASVFVDGNGARCPMAELIYRSGREDLVAAVAKEANGVRLADVHDGPLHAWMLASGLTRDEIAMVQGVMSLELDWLELQDGLQPILAGQAAVRAKLEIVEVALRDNTASALATAARAVPDVTTVDALAHTPVTGAVVSKAAVVKAQREAIVVPQDLRFRTGVRN